MIDYHCHLDLYPNPITVFEEVRIRKIDVLAVTTSPRAYVKTLQYFKGEPRVRVALGFHPELLLKRLNEWDMFLENIKTSSHLGEIGIDGSQQYLSSLDIQSKFFEESLIEAEKRNGRIISVHSRNATKAVLDIIEKTLVLNKPILHWFTGTNKDLERAIELGCWFSINPKMCMSKHGQEIISRIPVTKMLPETDGPFAVINNRPFFPWDKTVLNYIAKIQNTSAEKTLELFAQNLKNLEIYF